MKDIVTIGEVLIDLTYSGRENGIPVYTANPGGAPANVAVAAARLGADAAFIGKVGKDYYGDFLRKTLEDNTISFTIPREELTAFGDSPVIFSVLAAEQTPEQ